MDFVPFVPNDSAVALTCEITSYNQNSSLLHVSLSLLRALIQRYEHEYFSYPSGFQQLPTKLLRWVVEGELLTAEMIDRRVAL